MKNVFFNKRSLKRLSFYSLIAVLVGGYILTGLTMFQSKPEEKAFPYLRERLGTILSHSDVERKRNQKFIDLDNKEFHVYCYYPSSSTEFSNKSGEYIIKRVENYSDCQGWHGVAQFREGPWVSEIEKIWWSKEQKAEASTIKVATSQDSNNSNLD